MRNPAFLAVLSAVIPAYVTAQGVPSAQGHSSAPLPSNVAASVSPVATDEIPPIAGLTTTSTSSYGLVTTSMSSPAASSTSSTSGVSTTSGASSITSSSSPVNSATINYNSIPFGSTLSNGAYICNPAHFYASTLSCDDSNVTPTLVTVSATSMTAAGSSAWSAAGSTTVVTASTVANGSVVSYTSWTPTSPWVGTWTGAAAVNVVPFAGAVIAGAVAFIA